jgi:hypothetical protein
MAYELPFAFTIPDALEHLRTKRLCTDSKSVDLRDGEIRRNTVSTDGGRTGMGSAACTSSSVNAKRPTDLNALLDQASDCYAPFCSGLFVHLKSRSEAICVSDFQSAHGRRSLDLALTAVHEEFTAGDVTAFVGGEECDRFGDLISGSRSP